MSTHTRTSEGVDALGLGSVLVGSLPATLLTESAPQRYTVEAVFTRRPDPAEVGEILGDATRTVLADSGYPDVRVTISDRRLEIAHTTLEELRDGLADVLASRLADISTGVRQRRDAAAAQFEIAAVHEQERAAAVAALAETVTFHARPGRPDGADTTTDEWDDDGGHGR